MSGTRFGLVLLTLLAAGTAPAQDAGPLPVKRVVLYKNGVGYFEHVGKVRDKQDVSIPFTSGQLNDVLKSLTVLDLDGGRITGVEYGSAAPLERQMGDLRLSLDDKTTLTGFLESLRGARIEIRSGNSVATGRLLSVERKTRMGGGATLEVDYVSLIGDNGELKTTEVAPGFAVRLCCRDGRSWITRSARTGTTCSFRWYQLASLPAGTLRVDVQSRGFRMASVRGLNVSANRPATGSGSV